MDNQRWVSDNDFRQIPQLFDGVMASYTGIANTELAAGYFNHLRDTSGDVDDIRLTIAHGAWNPLPGHAFGAYAYFHDQAGHVELHRLRRQLVPRGRACAPRAARSSASDRVSLCRGGRAAEALRGRRLAHRRALLARGRGRRRGRLDACAPTTRSKGSNDGRYGLQMPLTDFYAFNGWTLHFFTTAAAGAARRAGSRGAMPSGP